MGRYDFPSEGSRSGFFSNGVMYAALNCVGNTPDDSDLMFGDEWRQHIHIVFEKMRWKLSYFTLKAGLEVTQSH